MAHFTAPVRREKRKVFGALSANGKRKALQDLRSLFKHKEAEYSEPSSNMAGFVIQQVWSLVVFLFISVNWD